MHARPQTSSSSEMEMSQSTPLTSIGHEMNEFSSPPLKPNEIQPLYQEFLPRLPAVNPSSVLAPVLRSDRNYQDSNPHSQMNGAWFTSSFGQPGFGHSNRMENSDGFVDTRKDTGDHHLAAIYTQPFGTSSEMIQQQWHITSEIILRSTSGERGQDVHYPCDPRHEDIWYSLQDPNAPSAPGHSAATTHHLQFYNYGPGQVPRNQIMPPPQIDRAPGALPYTSPTMESYFHVDLSKRPRRQDEKLRFPGDLYTPRWVRGDGIAREGWCSLCHSGSWMQLKTSQYWYHVRFTHGVNSNTGRIYDPPLQLRVCDDNLGSTYGFCGECHDWVPICTPRRKRSFTAWFKHAHKCHRRAQHLVGGFFHSVIRSNDGAADADLQKISVDNKRHPELSPQSSPVVSIFPTPAPQMNEPFINNGPSVSQRASWPSAPTGFVLPPCSDQNQATNGDGQGSVSAAYSTLFNAASAGHRRTASEGWSLHHANSNVNLFNNRIADIVNKTTTIPADNDKVIEINHPMKRKRESIPTNKEKESKF